jgi:hypothetical protein
LKFFPITLKLIFVVVVGSMDGFKGTRFISVHGLRDVRKHVP